MPLCLNSVAFTVVLFFVHRKPVIYIEYRSITAVIGRHSFIFIVLLNARVQFMWTFGSISL